MSVRNFINISLVLPLLFIASFAFSQDQMQKRTPEERAQRQMTWMQKNLGLSDDQNKKAHDILLHYAQLADKTMNTPPGAEKKAERQGMMQDREADLKAVLTGEQFQKYQQHVQEMKEKMQQRGGMQGGN